MDPGSRAKGPVQDADPWTFNLSKIWLDDEDGESDDIISSIGRAGRHWPQAL